MNEELKYLEKISPFFETLLSSRWKNNSTAVETFGPETISVMGPKETFLQLMKPHEGFSESAISEFYDVSQWFLQLEEKENELNNLRKKKFKYHRYLWSRELDSNQNQSNNYYTYHVDNEECKSYFKDQKEFSEESGKHETLSNEKAMEFFYFVPSNIPSLECIELIMYTTSEILLDKLWKQLSKIVSNRYKDPKFSKWIIHLRGVWYRTKNENIRKYFNGEARISLLNSSLLHHLAQDNSLFEFILNDKNLEALCIVDPGINILWDNDYHLCEMIREKVKNSSPLFRKLLEDFDNVQIGGEIIFYIMFLDFYFTNQEWYTCPIKIIVHPKEKRLTTTQLSDLKARKHSREANLKQWEERKNMYTDKISHENNIQFYEKKVQDCKDMITTEKKELASDEKKLQQVEKQVREFENISEVILNYFSKIMNRKNIGIHGKDNFKCFMNRKTGKKLLELYHAPCPLDGDDSWASVICFGFFKARITAFDYIFVNSAHVYSSPESLLVLEKKKALISDLGIHKNSVIWKLKSHIKIRYNRPLIYENILEPDYTTSFFHSCPQFEESTSRQSSTSHITLFI